MISKNLITFPTSVSEGYTALRKALLPVPEPAYQSSNTLNIFPKFVALVKILDCNVSWIYKYKNKQQP